MALDTRVKGGLAWLGLVVVLAVPAADMVMGKGGGAVVPAVPAPQTALRLPSADPVARRVESGKGLPSYISDRNADEARADATRPVKAVLPTPSVKPAAVAAVPEATLTPPMPLPRDARPKGTLVADAPSAGEEPLVLDEATVRRNEAAAGVAPFPLSDAGGTPKGDSLDTWDTQSLADYLASKGLISNDRAEATDTYDPDGFYLDEGPNNARPRKTRRLDDWFIF